MRNLRAKIFLLLAAAVAGDVLILGEAAAQAYPNKPIRIITGFVSGGSTDIIARLVGQKLSESLGQPVIVENRPGASTAIAAERVATSPPDGYTLFLVAASTTIQSALRKNLPARRRRSAADWCRSASAPTPTARSACRRPSAASSG